MAAHTVAAHTHSHRHRHKPATKSWTKKHHVVIARILEGVAGLALLSVIVQVAYPAQRTLPFLQLGGISVGAKTALQLEQTLDWYGQNATVSLKSPSREWQSQWQQLGVGIDRKSSVRAALHYEWWERVIPFSSLARIAQSRNLPLVTLVDEDRLESFASTLVTEDKKAATNASIEVKDGHAQINEAKNGYQYAVDSVKRQIRTAQFALNGQVELVPDPVLFARSATELTQLAQAANQILSAPLTIRVAEKEYKPDRQQVGSWLQFAEDPATQKMVLHFNTELIGQYLDQINQEVAGPAGVMTVTLMDGQEIARSGGSSSQAVDVGAGVQALTARLQQPSPDPLQLPLTQVAPAVKYDRQYSNTSAGLLAIIRDWESTTYGTYGIIVREIGGQNRYAEFQPDRSFVTASTFKLFVYLAVAKKIEQGAISYGQATDMGWSVEDCLEEMIVNSTNPCAISLLNLVGWETAQAIAVESGFASTNINNSGGGDKHSTIRDETNYMLRLNAGTLMGQEPTARLLGYLKRQIWRGGIPSGVPRGVTVADKVGFYNGWVHDVAIVYSPGATYILGIMSKGGSDPVFAGLSRRVYDFFN